MFTSQVFKSIQGLILFIIDDFQTPDFQIKTPIFQFRISFISSIQTQFIVDTSITFIQLFLYHLII
ncbi:MAG: hypothetical protein LBU14_04440 [Candidatus Peribacteria bacterium]|nr:hypothetical protein [Candidatus Peribacteria bacterium]